MAEPCENCLMYRRGEIENIVWKGHPFHVCTRAPDELNGIQGCPCGCEMREPGQIDADKAMYGNAFLNERGGRIDPTTVRAA